MSKTSEIAGRPVVAARRHSVGRFVIGVVAFLTLVDLFAAQAVLPALAAHYAVSPAMMGLAVNACTFGMAAAGLSVALIGNRIPQRAGIVASLALLALPTAALALQPPLWIFAIIRVVQGVFMSAAFTLTVAYLAEQTSMEQTTGALAAYVTGNVASNLFGRLFAAAVTDHFGLTFNFLALAVLNIAGAVLVFSAFEAMPGMARGEPSGGSRQMRGWLQHLKNPALLAMFGIGFLILFAFIGTFSYVNFVLVGAPLKLQQMSLGFVYLVFIPSLVLTPQAGKLADRFGAKCAIRGAFVAAIAGLPLLLLPALPAVLIGLSLVGAGTFAAQALATGFTGRIAMTDRGAASGLYLASYYLGGLAGSAVLGRIFERAGWTACVGAIACALSLALLLTWRIAPSPTLANTSKGESHA